MAGRKSFITNLTDEHIFALHTRIRNARYGEHDDMVDWLKSLGYAVSRSAMARYSGELKRRDGYEGTAGSFTLHSAINDAPDYDMNLANLYKELGEIEYRKVGVLERIREIVDSKISTIPR
ncbi:hypothetical protein ACF3VQ_09245 [Yersinia sp. HM-2024]|uniref:hypothetical protein n=1 Tax=Yersinia sp. HM-2024 TaxID=3344550 RepID=UPI00370D7462